MWIDLASWESLEMNVYAKDLENLVRSPMIGTQPRETADKC